MSALIHDSENAAECLDHLQTLLWEGGDHSQDEEITSLICMLQSPLFRQLLVLQDSIQELKQVEETRGLQGCDFNFTPELQLQTAGQTNPVFVPDTPIYTLSLKGQAPATQYQATAGYDQEFERVIKAAARGREVEEIRLFKPEKQSLGFSVVTNQGESGIYVQDIQPGGIAERDGRLRERDQILAIDGQPLDISHQEAIKILQNAGGQVELIVARGSAAPDKDTQPTADISDMLNTEWTH